jgi:hypothetical protein
MLQSVWGLTPSLMEEITASGYGLMAGFVNTVLSNYITNIHFLTNLTSAYYYKRFCTIVFNE